MENTIKYMIITLVSILLIIPIVFGFNIRYLIIRKFNPFIILLFLFGLLILIVIGKYIEVFVFNKENVELMQKHDVIKALTNKNNKIVIWLFFPLTMIMEELIFRYYLIGFLLELLYFNEFSGIFISSLIFSLYHIHTWFSFKDLTILSVNLIYPFLMGLYIGFIFLNLGIVPCILSHYLIAFSFYSYIYRKYFNNNKNKKK
ncbi:MAG: CPBP family intramembrane glutamic endopeptidase [Candidatus Odinarchaeota archaeon]